MRSLSLWENVVGSFREVPFTLVVRPILSFDAFGLVIIKDFQAHAILYAILGIGGGFGGGSIRGD